MEKLDIHIVEFGSEIYQKSIELRYRVLREPLGMVYTPEQLAAEKDEIHIVAVRNERVLGVLLLKMKNETALKMRQVAVEPYCQHFGIGTQLVAFAEQYAVQHKFTAIELHARDAAKDFYLKLNYTIIGEQFLEVGLPHYKMIKTF